MIESGHFIDFGLGQSEKFRQCRHVRRAELPIAIIDQVQVLDQQVVTPGPRTDQRRNLGQGLRGVLAAPVVCAVWSRLRVLWESPDWSLFNSATRGIQYGVS